MNIIKWKLYFFQLLIDRNDYEQSNDYNYVDYKSNKSFVSNLTVQANNMSPCACVCVCVRGFVWKDQNFGFIKEIFKNRKILCVLLCTCLGNNHFRGNQSFWQPSNWVDSWMSSIHTIHSYGTGQVAKCEMDVCFLFGVVQARMAAAVAATTTTVNNVHFSCIVHFG